MGEYDSAVALALRLLTKKGQEAILRAIAPAAGADPAMPWRPGQSVPTDQTVRMVFVAYKRQYIDGTQVQTGDQRVIMPATDTSGAAVAPTADMLIVRSAETWRIITVEAVNPGGQPIVYKCQVRR